MVIPLDRVPSSNQVTESLSGNDTLVDAADTGEINLGVIRRDAGIFSGRIKITGLEAAPAELSVGWGCSIFPRILPIFLDPEKADFAEAGTYIVFHDFDTSDIDNAQEYFFYLVNPDDPRAIPSIPEGEDLIIYLDYTGTGGDSVLVEVEIDYEAGSDFNIVEVE